MTQRSPNLIPTPGSSFVEAVGYIPTPRAVRYLVPEGCHGFVLVQLDSVVWCYAAPAWVYGLIRSAMARGTSVGRMYNRLCRGKVDAVRYEDALMEAPTIPEPEGDGSPIGTRSDGWDFGCNDDGGGFEEESLREAGVA